MVLVDTSVWIEYFKGNSISLPLEKLIDFNNICINDLILAELIPSINHKKEDELKEILYNISKVIIEVDWINIIHMQTKNLKNGIKIEIYAIDKHFRLMSEIHPIKIFTP